MPLDVVCSCGERFDVPYAHAGRRVKCPRCGAIMNVPAQGEKTAQPASRKRRWALLGLGVLLLALAGTGVAWWLWPRPVGSDGPEVSDVDLIPANAEGFTSVRVAELWAMPAVKGAIDAAREADPGQEDVIAELERLTGLTPSEVERLHGVGLALDRRLAWFVVGSVEPLDRAKVLSRLKGRRELWHRERRYHLGKTRDDEEVAYHFAGPSVLVISNEEGMKHCLDQAAAPVTKGQLEPVIARLGGKSQVLLAWAPSPSLRESIKKNPQVKGLPDVQLLRASADVDKQAIIDLWLTTADEAEAKKAHDWLSEWQKKLNHPLTGWITRGVIAATLKVPASLVTQLAKLKPQVKGKEIGVQMKTDPASLVKALNQAAKQFKK
jgi:hypothetical protein